MLVFHATQGGKKNKREKERRKKEEEKESLRGTFAGHVCNTVTRCTGRPPPRFPRCLYLAYYRNASLVRG